MHCVDELPQLGLGAVGGVHLVQITWEVALCKSSSSTRHTAKSQQHPAPQIAERQDAWKLDVNPMHIVFAEPFEQETRKASVYTTSSTTCSRTTLLIPAQAAKVARNSCGHVMQDAVYPYTRVVQHQWLQIVQPLLAGRKPTAAVQTIAVHLTYGETGHTSHTCGETESEGGGSQMAVNPSLARSLIWAVSVLYQLCL